MKTQKLVASMVLVLLAGCGEETSSEQSNNILAPLVGDGFQILSQSEKQTTVSLSDLIIDPQGLPVTLESVESSNQGCEEPISINAKALSFTVTNTNPEMCLYRYVVKNHPKKASQSRVSEANSYVLKSASNDASLPPLSETTQVDHEVIVPIPAISSYILDDDVIVLGDGSAFVELADQASKDAGTVNYTPSAQGVTRLIYTMTNESKTDIKMGTIDISVSDTGNTPPEVQPVELKTQPENNGYYDINQTYTIDLSKYIQATDKDGDDVQLIQVKAWNANVALAAPDELANLSFTFQTSRQGAHYVTYAVSDHRGGYGVEQVRIETYDLSSGATWNDIQKGAKRFSAPLTQSEALVSEVPFTSSHMDVNGAIVATFSFSQAKNFCDSKGHLPTPANLIELAGFDGGPSEKGWPVDMAFWANDDGTPALINLATGATEETGTANNHYVTCLNEGGFVIDTNSSDFDAVANGADNARIAVKVTLNGEPVEGQLVEASTTNTNVTLDEQTGTTDDSGSTSFALSSLVAEQVPVDITYSGETLTQNVTFVAGEANSIRLAITRDNATDDAPDGNEVEATMVDAYQNPVVGRSVTFDSDADTSVTITPEATTNAFGKQKASVVWNGGKLTEDAIVNVTAKFTPLSTRTEIADTAAVTFTSTSFLPICGGVDDADPSNAKGNCLKVATDKAGNWFTSTPSVVVLSALGYRSDTNSSNTGDTYADTNQEGPGTFARFQQNGAGVIDPPNGDGTNGQFDRWCKKLNALKFGGKTTWKRPTSDELSDFYKKYSGEGLSSARGWPTGDSYWSAAVNGSNYYSVRLSTGRVSSSSPGFSTYASCVSKNP